MCLFILALGKVGTYSQNNLSFIDVNQLLRKLGNTLCRALPGYHAFMGYDYAAALYRKGKVRPFKTLENNLAVFGRMVLKKK